MRETAGRGWYKKRMASGNGTHSPEVGYSERKLTYTYGLRLQEGEELEEQGRGAYWQITGLRLWMDGCPFIKTGDPLVAKVVVNNRYLQVSGRYLFT